MDAVIVIGASTKEIAALVREIQERQPIENEKIDFGALAYCAVKSIQDLSARLEAK